MPLFEYNCDNCQKIFEALVYSKEEKVVCPFCGSASIDKQLSTFGVGAVHSIPSCPGGACGLPQPMPGCNPGSCPGCMH